ncbi:glyceraldehyde-3-phosphate dehydrogenase [Roseisalinus antarcticus]|uniref:Uncharacterized protein n=1 Tax=Roseisalinus antarcticus TaxID=254357 RepID=A0A1Y5RG85_9RHOB|nr:glyceraldehyde-3-phosphate dehydrogenase [Roseisalinus antarcticus]SLN16503.1 hypothetical protein ROA7023_00298 [Roseisalinus antarcticus]
MLLRSSTFWLVLFIVALIVADLVWAEGRSLLFLARKGVELISWLAFWR